LEESQLLARGDTGTAGLFHKNLIAPKMTDIYAKDKKEKEFKI
jgi:hypothetical protein